MTRTQKTFLLFFAVAALILGLLVAKALSGRGDASQAQLIDAGIILLPQSRSVPAVGMIDQNGQPFAADQLKGKWSLVFFGYTYCPDICPTTLAQLRQVKSQLPKDTLERLQVVLVSVDPNRDTPQQLKQYLVYFDKDFIGLAGSIEDTQTLAKALSIPFVPADTRQPGYTVDHSGNLALLGPDGRQRGFIRAPFDNGKLVAQLPKLVAQP
ncbi:SCO family protein [Pseudomonas sp. S75]|uniref:SCO family protein n=1 Tax=unclassified Pseudomonas TaxID=196821 RepID=UPI001905F083|nr:MULTISPECIES: SCO family protein [unclassified Pseudomonas]MBJ9974532.1 SCO family protein [Pseudomonas sp. S30]MBK0153311.1 SCO family protein [Pseudomonas sp. S75]